MYKPSQPKHLIYRFNYVQVRKNIQAQACIMQHSIGEQFFMLVDSTKKRIHQKLSKHVAGVLSKTLDIHTTFSQAYGFSYDNITHRWLDDCTTNKWEYFYFYHKNI